VKPAPGRRSAAEVSFCRTHGKTSGMRTVFAIYGGVILAGIVLYAVVGLTHS
jgi:hypothetical protein